MTTSPTLQELRAKYRAVLTEGGYTPDELKRRCEGRMRNRSITPTPEAWVCAAEAIQTDDEYEAQGGDDEGYLGTGMSEAAYFTAAGSAEFL